MKTIYIFILLGGSWPAVVSAISSEVWTTDQTFRPQIDGWVSTMALQTNGDVLIGGSFTNAHGITNLARFLSNGSADESFRPNPEVAPGVLQSPINTIEIQADGKILIAGAFSRVNEISRSTLARLNVDGTLDPIFNPILSNESGPAFVSTIALQRDRKILVGGDFTVVNESDCKSLARLNEDGSLDTTFKPFSDIAQERVRVYGIGIQSDGKLLAYGRFFTSFDRYRHYLRRMHSDGSLDVTFSADTSDEVELLAVQSDGKILIGGDFHQVDGVSRLGLARLRTNGTLDSAFAPAGNYGGAYVVAPLPNGTVLVGGEFEESDRVGGLPLNAAPDFLFPNTGLIQLENDGALKEGVRFEGDGMPSVVSEIELQTDGNLLVMGTLKPTSTKLQSGVARLIRPLQNEVSVCCTTVVDGFLRFDLLSSSARTVMVEMSTSLTVWNPLQSIELSPGIPAHFQETHSNSIRSKFFRISSQQ